MSEEPSKVERSYQLINREISIIWFTIERIEIDWSRYSRPDTNIHILTVVVSWPNHLAYIAELERQTMISLHELENVHHVNTEFLPIETSLDTMIAMYLNGRSMN